MKKEIKICFSNLYVVFIIDAVFNSCTVIPFFISLLGTIYLDMVLHYMKGIKITMSNKWNKMNTLVIRYLYFKFKGDIKVVIQYRM